MTRCGYVAILGAPNAGKSTLINALVGSKVAIVTPKVQTTRNRIVGICLVGDTQLVVLDTPGIYTPLESFEKAMVASAWSAVADADVVLLMVDASLSRGISADTKQIIEGLKKTKKTVWLVLNKVDVTDKPVLLERSQQLYALYDFDKSFMISAQKGSGLDMLKEKIAAQMPEGPWLFPEDQMTTQSERNLAAEITREKIFMRLHQELPYSVHVETEEWLIAEDKQIRLRQLIYVQRESHKKIILGNKGEMLKAIGTAARLDMQKQFDVRIHLSLFVKVREGWKNDREIYRTLELEYKS